MQKINKTLASIFIYSALLGAAPALAASVDRPYLKATSIVIVMGGNDFSDNGGSAPFAVDFNLLNSATGTQANDIIASDGVAMNFNTGQYNPIGSGMNAGYEYDITNPTFGGNFISAGPHQTLDENDAYTEFGLDENTDIDLVTGNRFSIFLVASNAAFDIYAQSSNLATTGDFNTLGYDNIEYKLQVKITGGSGVWKWGQKAWNPSNGGAGIINSVDYLDDMVAQPVKVFDGGRRTAKDPGTILQQAVAFRSRYRLRGAASLINGYDLSMGHGSIGATVTYTIYTP